MQQYCDRENFHDDWYAVDVCRMRHHELAGRFVQCNFDQETQSFLTNCEKLHDRLQLQIWHAICIPILRLFLRQTCVNALLNRGAMFLFSSVHLATLLRPDFDAQSSPARTVLDLGAGDGHVTTQYRHFFANILATETSSFMCQRLKEKGIVVIGVDDWQHYAGRIDLISCLNLLDRHPRPRSLLAQLYKKSVESQCSVLLSVVLPWYQYVEYSNSGSTMAEEVVHVDGDTFEERVESFVDHLLRPAGFAVRRFTRLPYLCEGNLHEHFFLLNSVLFLLTPV